MKYMVSYTCQYKNGNTGSGRSVYDYTGPMTFSDIVATEKRIVEEGPNGIEKAALVGFYLVAEEPEVKNEPDNPVNPL